MEPASSALSTASYYFDYVPLEMFESISEFVAGEPLVKKEGFDDTVAERKLADMPNKISHEAIVDLEALHAVRPGYKNPVTDAIFHSKLPEAISTTNMKRGKAWIHFTTDSISKIKLAYPDLSERPNNSYCINKSKNEILGIKVRCGIIQEFIRIKNHYFVATDRGLFIYDPEKDKENPLFSLGIKLDYLHAGGNEYVLVGRCEDGRFLILDFRDKKAPKVNQDLPKASKIEFIKRLFNNLIFEPAKAAIKSITSLEKWEFGFMALGVTSAVLLVVVGLINWVVFPAISLLSLQLVLTVLFPALIGVAAILLYVGAEPTFAACSQLHRGIQKSMMQYKCYFSGK